MGIRRGIVLAALSCVLLLGSELSQAFIAIGVSVGIEPPPLPLYVQPAIPAPGYLWTPGYWAWGGEGYFWVPGTWVLAPQPGYLWTPGYWAFDEGAYFWHGGYWGPHVGFYGGVNYGFGYTGSGYFGGEWRGGAFFYNRAVNHIGPGASITNVYNRTVVNNVSVNRVSYNGGPGGVQARPSPAELTANRAPHLNPVGAQLQHEQAARSNTALQASVNHGNPPIAATQRPGQFSGRGVVAARGAAGGPAQGAAPGHGRATGGAPRAATQHAASPHGNAAPRGRQPYSSPQRGARPQQGAQSQRGGGAQPQRAAEPPPREGGPQREGGQQREGGPPHGEAGPHQYRRAE